MKRTSFGAKFIAEGQLATSGTLQVQIEGAPEMELALTSGDDYCPDDSDNTRMQYVGEEGFYWSSDQAGYGVRVLKFTSTIPSSTTASMDIFSLICSSPYISLQGKGSTYTYYRFSLSRSFLHAGTNG